MIVRRSRWYGWVAVVAASAALLAGCTGRGTTGDGETSPSPAAPPPPTPAMPTTSPSPTESAIQFKFQPPDRTCPPVSALRLPPVDGHDYASIDPLLTELDSHIGSICEYRLAGLTVEESDMILDDHVYVFAQISVRPSSADLASFIKRLDDLPLASTDLDDWVQATTIFSSDRGVVWEGCGNATPCAEGEEPRVRTRAVRVDIDGRVGNLQFMVGFGYTAEHLPPDVERRSLAIFRDLVLADVANRERA